MRISQLSTLAKTSVGSSDYLLTTNTSANTNKKTLVSNLFPTITNYGSTSGAVSIITAVANKNEYTLSKIVAGSSKITVTGGGGAADISLDVGAVNFTDLIGTVSNAQLAGLIDITTKVSGLLPIANGGTASSSTTYCDLTANVTGTLPVANGGTNLTSFTANKIFYASSSSVIAQIDDVGAAGYLLIGTGSKPLWRAVGDTASITWALGSGSLSANVIALPSLTADIGWDTGSARVIKPANNSGGAGDALTVQAGTSTTTSVGGALNLNAGGGGASAGGVVSIKSGSTVASGGDWGGDIKLQQQNQDTAGTTDILKVYHNMVGISNNQGSSITPAAMLHVEQSLTGGAKSVMELEQDDVDQPFIKFTGTSASDQTKSLTTDTSVGSLTGHILVNINGTEYWVPFYAQN